MKIVALACALAAPALLLAPASPARDAGVAVDAGVVTVVETATATASRGTTLDVDREVAPGDPLRVAGRVARRFAGARITLARAADGSWRREAVGRVGRRGTFVLRTQAAATPGRSAYRVATRVQGARTRIRFTVLVVEPAVVPATTPTTVPTSTPTPTPAPVTPTPAPVPGPAAAGNPDDWTYIGGEPLRWDPCTPITWSVAGPAPYSSSDQDLAAALDLVGARSGLTFVRVGDAAQSTLDVSWGTEAEHPQLAGSVLGFGGPSYRLSPSGPHRIVAGMVVLDASETLAPGAMTAPRQWGQVMVHELMHAVGLGHAAGREQIMYPSMTANHLFGAGDLTGLQAVGASQGCLTAAGGTKPTGYDVLE